MKFLPTLGGSMSGSLGGLTASHNRGGQYLRRRSVPTNTATDAQDLVRQAMSSLSFDWSNTLTAEQRIAWNNYAENVPWTDSLGQSIKLSGVNHFVRSNIPRIQADIALGTSLGQINDAPLVNTLAPQPLLGAASIEVTIGPPPTFDFEIVLDGATADQTQLIYASPPVNSGVSFWRGPFFLVAARSNTDPLTFDLLAGRYPERYTSGVSPGQRIIVRVTTAMTADARLSTGAYTSAVYVVPPP